jgi:hypothetical protein
VPELLKAVREVVRYQGQDLSPAQIVIVLAEVMSDHTADAYHEQQK